MSIEEVVKRLECEVLCGKIESKQADGFYIGDFLSHVMGSINENDLWFTIMNNVNVCAVATLVNACGIVLVEGVTPDDMLLKKCKEKNVLVLKTKYNAFDSAAKILQP